MVQSNLRQLRRSDSSRNRRLARRSRSRSGSRSAEARSSTLNNLVADPRLRSGRHKLRRHRQLRGRQSQCLLSHLRSDLDRSTDLKDDLAHVRPAGPVLKSTFTFAHTSFIALDADGDIREHAQEHLCAFDHLQLALQRRLGSYELFGRQTGGGEQPDTISTFLDGGALGGAPGVEGDGDLMCLAVLCSPWGEISLVSNTAERRKT